MRRLRSLPLPVRAAITVATAAVLLAAANLVYQVARKPADILGPLGGTLDKTPAETWQEYGPLFQQHATAAIPAELLAALAQVEGAGNPVATTYWKWNLTWRPFELFRPASSAVGMYQMTDAAFADARRYCIRDHRVVDPARGGACPPPGRYSRILPSHAVELAAISLDRQAAAILGRLPAAKPAQVHHLAAVIHLCGATRGAAFVSRGFRLVPGERCGDHDAQSYLTRVRLMQDRFRRLGAKPPP